MFLCFTKYRKVQKKTYAVMALGVHIYKQHNNTFK